MSRAELFALSFHGNLDIVQTFSSPTEDDPKKTKEKSHRSESLRMPNLSPSDNEESSIRLGLGDFIFYSLLIGLTATQDDWIIIIACYIAIMTGLFLTMILLVIFKKILDNNYALREAVNPKEKRGKNSFNN
ncbi:hypothetical protein TELCIR_03105 [Teladorsagia circumcincta]|uniref:Uncharacterized protein n=1 Tax=Teladorsagia circumcincta TaxID=45464 RepID=A0A2G9UXA7_TELCI|nr:hypothetical protein TELCIR_03105 [Teladorsagia circumcincta]